MKKITSILLILISYFSMHQLVLSQVDACKCRVFDPEHVDMILRIKAKEVKDEVVAKKDSEVEIEWQNFDITYQLVDNLTSSQIPEEGEIYYKKVISAEEIKPDGLGHCLHCLTYGVNQIEVKSNQDYLVFVDYYPESEQLVASNIAEIQAGKIQQDISAVNESLSVAAGQDYSQIKSKFNFVDEGNYEDLFDKKSSSGWQLLAYIFIGLNVVLALFFYLKRKKILFFK